MMVMMMMNNDDNDREKMENPGVFPVYPLGLWRTMTNDEQTSLQDAIQ